MVYYLAERWDKFILNSKNKINLCDFLSESFWYLGRQQLPPDKTLVIGGGFNNGSRAEMVRSSNWNDLESDHEEADTR